MRDTAPAGAQQAADAAYSPARKTEEISINYYKALRALVRIMRTGVRVDSLHYFSTYNMISSNVYRAHKLGYLVVEVAVFLRMLALDKFHKRAVAHGVIEQSAAQTRVQKGVKARTEERELR